MNYLGAVFLILCLGADLSVTLLGYGRMQGRAGGSQIAAMTVAYTLGLFFTAMHLALGRGLTRLKPSAQWTEVLLMTLSLVVALIVAVGSAVANGHGASKGISGFFCSAIIPSCILLVLISRESSIVFSPEYRAIIGRGTPHIKWKLFPEAV